MARLFVANCSQQYQEIHFRLDFHDRDNPTGRVPPAKRQTVAPGRQVCLGGDLHMTQISEIVEQLKPYGLIGVMDVGRSRAVTPYIFDIDKAIKPGLILDVRRKNQEVLQREGKELREKAAVAVNETVADTVARQFAEQGIPAEAEQDVELEFEQQDQSEAGEKRIEEGYRVDAKAPEAKTAGKAPRKGRGKH